MIDSYFRTPYQTAFVDPFLPLLERTRIHPLQLTFLGLLVGGLVLPFLAWGWGVCAFACLLFSGYLDTLDGSLARRRNLHSDAGAACDILCDRCVEFAVILGFYLQDPNRGFACLFMLGCVLICVTSFLVVGIFTQNDSHKSFHYNPGLMERTEAFLFFGAMMLFPQWFSLLSWSFSILVLGTGLRRVWRFSLK